MISSLNTRLHKVAWIIFFILSDFIFAVKAQNTETSTVDEPALYLFKQIGNGLLLGSFMFMFVMILSVRAIRKQIESETRNRGS